MSKEYQFISEKFNDNFHFLFFIVHFCIIILTFNLEVHTIVINRIKKWKEDDTCQI